MSRKKIARETMHALKASDDEALRGASSGPPQCRELGESFLAYLESEIWPQLRDGGKQARPLTRSEEDDILGYGADGV